MVAGQIKATGRTRKAGKVVQLQLADTPEAGRCQCPLRVL